MFTECLTPLEIQHFPVEIPLAFGERYSLWETVPYSIGRTSTSLDFACWMPVASLNHYDIQILSPRISKCLKLGTSGPPFW